MSESKRFERQNRYGNALEPGDTQANINQVEAPLRRLAQSIDRVIPNERTVDGIAYQLARRTPRTIVICMVLLIAGIVASRLDLWVEGFLWGIPSLGAISMGIGFWVWSSNVMLRPDLSVEARQALKRAMRLQTTMIVAGIAALIYFIGMALRFW